jgi:hypothetical protein
MIIFIVQSGWFCLQEFYVTQLGTHEWETTVSRTPELKCKVVPIAINPEETVT